MNRLIVAFVALFATQAASAVSIIDTGTGPIALPGDFGARELSDLAYSSGQFYAVGDQDNLLYRLSVPVDPLTGRIDSSPQVIDSSVLSDGSGAAFAGGRDFEGLTSDGVGGLLASGEAGNQIYRFAAGGGMALQISQPAAFNGARGNLGIEAITSANGVVWAANEEALAADGPASNSGDATTVRLQQFDAALNPLRQFAYSVDAIPASSFVLPQSRSGISGLLLLPNGELLVLERRTEADFVNGLSFVSSLYRVDFSGADDMTMTAALDSTVNTVAKQLLWSGRFGDDNFEGLALGPELANGDLSLLLVSDNGGGLNQSLLALVVSGANASAVPTPGSLWLITVMCGQILWRRYHRANWSSTKPS